MAGFLRLKFWIVCCIVYVGMRWQGDNKARWFGILNLAALGMLGGWALAFIAAMFALASWGVLATAQRLLSQPAPRAVTAARHPALNPTHLTRRHLVLAGGANVSCPPGALPIATRSADTGRPKLAAPFLAAVAIFCALGIPILLFAFHKFLRHSSSLADAFDLAGNGVLETPLFTALKALAFSYVILRYLDAAHCTLWKQMPLLGPLGFAGFLFPFHMIAAGPVNRYDEHLKLNEAGAKKESTPWLLALNDITAGLVFKYVLADYLRLLVFGEGTELCSTNWFDTAALFGYIFLDFAGYSHIVLGIGRLLGVPTPANFRAPFGARSVTEFFARWHISLGAFTLRNIYTPIHLQLTRKWGIKRTMQAGCIALLASWTFVGLWHRFSLAFLCYGLGMATLVWIEKWVRAYILKQAWALRPAATRMWNAVGPLYVFALITSMLHPVINELLKG